MLSLRVAVLRAVAVLPGRVGVDLRDKGVAVLRAAVLRGKGAAVLRAAAVLPGRVVMLLRGATVLPVRQRPRTVHLRRSYPRSNGDVWRTFLGGERAFGC